jgi:hypothetical protein
LFVRSPHKRRRVNGLESLSEARDRIAEIIDPSRVVNFRDVQGRTFTGPPSFIVPGNAFGFSKI